MNAAQSWVAAVVTVALVILYELQLAVTQRRQPERFARSAHANLRQDWFAAISAHPGSEVLAVQTLRNSLMSASMIASTAVLALMGTITLAGPSLQASLGAQDNLPGFTPRLALELVLLALLFGSLVSSVMAVRFFNHAGYIGAMPVDSAARKQWTAAGIRYVRRAGLLYSWSLRNLVLVVPVVAFILYPLAGPVAAVLVVAVLYGFDRVQSQGD